jgi:hypothetical protein
MRSLIRLPLFADLKTMYKDVTAEYFAQLLAPHRDDTPTVSADASDSPPGPSSAAAASATPPASSKDGVAGHSTIQQMLETIAPPAGVSAEFNKYDDPYMCRLSDAKLVVSSPKHARRVPALLETALEQLVTRDLTALPMFVMRMLPCAAKVWYPDESRLKGATRLFALDVEASASQTVDVAALRWAGGGVVLLVTSSKHGIGGASRCAQVVLPGA